MPATPVRFADPTRCPDCACVLPPSPERCHNCGLPVHGPLALRLLETLRTADSLLAELRASAPTRPIPSPTPQPAASAPVPFPAPMPMPSTARTGVQGASVPKILLGLGATCLLVAAVIFLAVAWSWLGIGGRTAVLIGLTAATGAGGAWFGRRGLKLAAEALTTVCMGLLVLDVVGADNAGWLGDIGPSAFLCLLGGVLTGASMLLLLSPPRLITPQLVAPLGLALVVSGVGAQTGDYQAVAAGAVLAFALLAGFGKTMRADALLWTAALGSALSWLALGSLALEDAVSHASLRELWLEGHGWGLVTAALLVQLLLVVNRSDPLRQTCAAVLLSALTFVAVLPGLDEGLTRATLVMAAATVVWSVAATLVPPRWYAVPRVPLLGSALVPAGVAAALLLQGIGGMLTAGTPFTASYDVRLDPFPALALPVLLPVSVVALVVAAALALPRSRSLLWGAAAALGATGFATLGLHPVPLWTVLLPVVGVAVGLLVDAMRRTDEAAAAEGAIAGTFLIVGSAIALPSEHLTAAMLTLLVAASVTVLLQDRFADAAEAAGAVLPAALASLIWTVGEIADVDKAWRAAPILVVLGLLAIVRARHEVELSAAASAIVAAAAAIWLAPDVSVSLAAHLTIAGVLVTASALINADRRWLGWAGGALLAAATWVRLYDVGVVEPEPYTLPSAVALLLVGLRRLQVAPSTETMPALGPGLVLGTVPSLVWVLADPVSLRAAVLGVACLVLLLAGVALRWNAPVVIGAVVGGLVVLRELAPYAAQTPQWVVIGLAGTVLITAGVTWESRMRDLQQAAAYLGRLR